MAAVAAQAYFDTDAYLRNDTIIPVRARLVRELLGDLSGVRLLDAGCGDGSLSSQFLDRPNSVTMLDFSERMLERARASVRPAGSGATVEFVRADLLAYEPQAPYDVVLCVGLLAHVPDPAAAIEKVAALVAVGGRCVVQFNDDDQLANRLVYRYLSWRGQPYALNRTTRRDLFEALLRAGLRPLAARRYGFVVPGVGKLRRRDVVRLQHLVARTGLGLQTLVLCERS